MAEKMKRLAPEFGSEEHTKTLAHAMSRVHTGQAAHDLMIPDWVENYKAFRALKGRNYPRNKQPWQTDHRPPYVAEQVNTMLPRLVEGNPNVEVLRGSPETSWDAVRAQKQYMNDSLRLDGYPIKAARLALTTILFNHAWSKQGFLHRQVQRDVINAEGQYEERWLTTAARPTMSVGHPFDVMGDPLAPSQDMGRFVVWRTMTTVGQVKAARRRQVRTKDGVTRWTGRYENTDEVYPFGYMERENMLPNEIIKQIPKHVSKRVKGESVELLEVMDRETDRIYTIANRCVVLRDQRLPWQHGDLPVSLYITAPDIGTMMGISKVDGMRGLQDNLWLREQQVVDNGRLQTDLVLLIRDTVLDMNAYQLGPGARWPVENMDDIQALQYPQPQLASMQDLEMMRARIQAYAGTAYMTGGDSSQMGMNQDTASGLMAIIEEGNRGVDFAMNMMREGHENALNQMLSNAAQFLDEPLFVPGAARGQDPIEINGDLLAAKSSVRVTLGSDTGMKSLRQQMAQTLLQAYAGFDPQVPIQTPQGPKTLNRMPIIEALADAYDRDPEDFLSDVQQAQEMTAPGDPAAMMAAAQEAEANPGVMMPGLPAGATAAPVGTVAA